eukprot:m.186268 g.186268  ORF g.186268 m.186268 type:complete len:230 (-) comp10525_c0_seq8:304-993(-)
MSAVRGVFSLLLLFSLLFMLHVADSLAVCFPCSLLHDQEAATAAAAPVKSEEDATLAPPPAPAPAASAASAASASSSSAAAATTTPSRSGGAGGSSSTGKKRKRETTEDAYRKFEAEHLNDAPHKFAFYRNVLEAQRPDLLLAYGGDKQAIDRLRKVLTFLRVISRDCQKETLLAASNRAAALEAETSAGPAATPKGEDDDDDVEDEADDDADDDADAESDGAKRARKA